MICPTQQMNVDATLRLSLTTQREKLCCIYITRRFPSMFFDETIVVKRQVNTITDILMTGTILLTINRMVKGGI